MGCEWVVCFTARPSWQKSLIRFFALVPCMLVEWGGLCRLPWKGTGRGCPPLPGHTAGLYFLEFRAAVLDNGMRTEVKYPNSGPGLSNLPTLFILGMDENSKELRRVVSRDGNSLDRQEQHGTEHLPFTLWGESEAEFSGFIYLFVWQLALFTPSNTCCIG